MSIIPRKFGIETSAQETTKYLLNQCAITIPLLGQCKPKKYPSFVKLTSQVGAWLDYYRTHSGREFMDQHKMHYTDYASIQVMFTTLLSRRPLTYTNKHS